MRLKLSGGIFAASHLVVDMACFSVLMGGFYRGVDGLAEVAAGFLLYNALAFALQLPLGFLADKVRVAPSRWAVSGCLLVVVGLLFLVPPGASPALCWVSLSLCALGNALFHIGGGIDSLVNAGGRFARSGVFISFGALGVALGTLMGKSGFFWTPWVVLLLLAAVVVMRVYCWEDEVVVGGGGAGDGGGRGAAAARASGQPGGGGIEAAGSRGAAAGGGAGAAAFSRSGAITGLGEVVVVLCLASIVIRALIGAYTPIPWRGDGWLFFLPACFVFLGKFLGGWLADRWGAKATVGLSLLVAAPLLAFGNANVALCCLGLFFFNVTTAVTLCVVAARLPKYPGVSFGLTTLALFFGSSPGFFWVLPEGLRPVLTIAMVLGSLLCVVLVAPNKVRPGRAAAGGRGDGGGATEGRGDGGGGATEGRSKIRLGL